MWRRQRSLNARLTYAVLWTYTHTIAHTFIRCCVCEPTRLRWFQLLYALAVSRIISAGVYVHSFTWYALTYVTPTHTLSLVSYVERNYLRSLPPSLRHTHTRAKANATLNIAIALSTQLVRFLPRSISFGSCICFEEQFLSCDSLRPIRITTTNFLQSRLSRYTHLTSSRIHCRDTWPWLKPLWLAK